MNYEYWIESMVNENHDNHSDFYIYSSVKELDEIHKILLEKHSSMIISRYFDRIELTNGVVIICDPN